MTNIFVLAWPNHRCEFACPAKSDADRRPLGASADFANDASGRFRSLPIHGKYTVAKDVLLGEAKAGVNT